MEQVIKYTLIVKVTLVVVCIGWIANVQAAPLSISDNPLFLGGAVPPNLVYILDDSGSMRDEVMTPIGAPTGYFRTRSNVFPNPPNVWGDVAGARNRVASFEDNNLHNYARRSKATNAIFYDPNVDYRPWVFEDNSEMANANPNCAYYDPMRQASGCLDLLVQKTEVARWYRNTPVDALAEDINLGENACDPNNVNATCAMTYWPATYFIYNGGAVENAANYDKVQLQGGTLLLNNVSVPNTASFSSVIRTPAEEALNFANWFQYHRARISVARAGTGRAFAQQGSGIRVGFGTLNTGFIGAFPSATIKTGTDTSSRQVDGATHPTTLRLGVRAFSGTDRQAFFNDLYTVDTLGDTPLRRALADIGLYYSRTDNRGPWGNTPGTNDNTPHSECRQSYSILTTDGFWDIDVPETTATSLGNVDNSSGPTITNHTVNGSPANYSYSPVPPFQDNHSTTVADVAMHFWSRDLRTDLLNKVPTSPQDEAFWQHMTTFTVGLGVSGTLDATDPTVLQDLTTGTLNWPDPLPIQNGTRIDDLWHAAINGRGQFLSAGNPNGFANALNSTLQAISDRTSSTAAVALSSGTITNNTKLYQARFDSGDWSGQILAFPVNMDGSLGPQIWDAGAVLNGQNFNTGRNIVTYKPSTSSGIPFRWPSNPSSPTSNELDLVQSAALAIDPATLTADGLGSARLNYLRGDTSNINFRTRVSVLGDIINSAPVLVGAPKMPYPDDFGSGAPENSTPYSSFKNNPTYVNRTETIYAGGNDGMLHAFRASDGEETFAYVPSAIYANLNQLTNPNYSHRFFVDGPVNVVDAYLGGGMGWRSVLAAGLGAGGQGVYVLDVSLPPNTSGGSEASVANKVLWEFTDANDADLGRTFGEVNIVRMHNGEWAGVFANGYNNTEADGNVSSSGNAVLYIVNLRTGALIRKLDTGEGTADDPSGTGRPNGLSSPAVIDVDGDFISDYIYAGDLFGNLWKFDVSSTNAASWGVANSGLPIFTAEDTNGDAQAITTVPQIKAHPYGINNGFVVNFGTGKYFENGDNSQLNQTTQSFYGVWDKNLSSTFPTFDRSDLLQQSIVQEVTASGLNLRITTDNPITWHTTSGTPSGSPPTTHLGWYMDLLNLQVDSNGNPTNNTNFGERQITNAVLLHDRVIFTTLIPSANTCDFGGTSWLMELDPNDGSRVNFELFDTNNDGIFDDGDKVQVVFDVNGDGVIDSNDTVSASGIQSNEGILSSPSLINNDDDGTIRKYSSGSTGNRFTVKNNKNPGALGRQTWRQINR